MKNLSVLIKPASSACNMDCKYCFYKDEAKNREIGFYGMTDEECTENIIKKATASAELSCTFMFQGGEPTLAGIDYFRHFIDLEKRYAGKKLKVYNALQTNGYAIDDEWATFFSKENFLIGLSLDGPADIHNRNRKDNGGGDTFNRIMKTAALFEKYRVSYNILSVLTSESIKKVPSIYNFFKKKNFGYIQFIPCLESLNESKAESRLAPTPEQYGDFLITVFRLWYNDLKQGRYVSIRHIDNYLLMLTGQPPESCNMNGRCSIQFVTEGSGDVYPCDFYVLDRYKLGNIKKDSFTDLVKNETAKTFIGESHIIPEECKTCRWYHLCRNGCRRDRDENGKNFYCASYKRFFEECVPDMLTAARILSAIHRH